ncbi:MAG TPA: hypothetical protein VEI98_11650 [Xanthobacteraceae bacterium]|nr:hypothetical protein [Xanthobacteraceae bacterium]
MRGGSKVVTDRPDPRGAPNGASSGAPHSAPLGADAFGQVLRFERRRAGKPLLHFPAIGHPAIGWPKSDDDDDFARYEREPDERIDYRQRMFMNVIALAVVTLLLGAGVWIADTIAAMEKDHDCLMQGRSNCAPVELPAPTRE